MNTNRLLEELSESSESSSGFGRRTFLRRAGLLGALASVPGIASFLAPGNAEAARPATKFPARAPKFRSRVLDGAILDFALNLEYLEAEYYLQATTGAGLSGSDITGISNDGTATPGAVTVKASPKVTFATPAIEDYANEIAGDEGNHVRFLRTALSAYNLPIAARPAIDLQNSFIALGNLIGVSNFDPFANEVNFLLGAFIFEDVGVTAYKGASPLVFDRGYLEAAAGILGVEAYHAGTVRTLLYQRGPTIIDLANKISAVRSLLDDQPEGATPLDQGIEVGGKANLVPTDSNSVAFSRTTRQVLNIVYGAPNATSGLFFPNGLNGVIR